MWTYINNENESEIRISLKLYTKINFKEDKDLNIGWILCKFEDNMGGHAVISIPPSVPRIMRNKPKLRRQD